MNSNREAEIRSEVEKIASAKHTDMRTRGWKVSPKVTQKSIKQLAELGLSIDMIDRRHMCQQVVDAVIAAAQDAGGKKLVSRGGYTLSGEGYSEVYQDTEASNLYRLLNTADEPTRFEVIETNSNYSEIPTGTIEDMSFADFVQAHALEIVDETTIRAEWGNGEGYDTFTVRFNS